jgi:hypothetical protein
MQRALLALVLLQVGCGPTLPETPDVEVTLSRVAVQGESRIRLTLTNLGESPSYYTGCNGVWLERETANGWVRATGDACIPGPRAPLEIAAGHSHRRDFSLVTAHAIRGAAHVTALGGSAVRLVTSQSVDTTP